jgi:hypothetical protein
MVRSHRITGPEQLEYVRTLDELKQPVVPSLTRTQRQHVLQVLVADDVRC